MLNGIAPIIIFQFSKKVSDAAAESVSKIPIVSSIVNTIGLPPIPLYLDEKLTGIIIDSEDKNIDIETSQDTLSDGDSPLISQKAIESSVKINMRASKDSIGLTILSAVADMILPKVTSQEYSISYLNGATTMFNAKLKSFQVNSSSENTLLNITLELIKGDNKTQADKGIPETKRFDEAVSLQPGVPPTAPNVPPVTGPTFTPTAPQPATPPVGITLG
jgi:hypothetical protein